MNIRFRQSRDSRYSVSCLAAFPMVLLFTSVAPASAQTPQTPYVLFQYSALTGSGNTITATQVPVVTAAGTTIYANMTLQFDVDANGNLSVSSGYPQFVPGPGLLVSAFKAGTYAGPATVYSGKMFITVSGPGIADGGATEWSIAASPDATGCTYPASASWYVGPTATSPLADRLKNAGITSTAWSYGISSGSQCTINGGSWEADTLIGVSQVGSTLTLVSFSKSGKDYVLPVDQVTYTLTPSAGK